MAATEMHTEAFWYRAFKSASDQRIAAERGLAAARADAAIWHDALTTLNEHGAPRYLVYIGDDGASCVLCDAQGGNPFIEEDVAEWPHASGCPLARAALEPSQ